MKTIDLFALVHVAGGNSGSIGSQIGRIPGQAAPTHRTMPGLWPHTPQPGQTMPGVLPKDAGWLDLPRRHDLA